MSHSQYFYNYSCSCMFGKNSFRFCMTSTRWFPCGLSCLASIPYPSITPSYLSNYRYSFRIEKIIEGRKISAMRPPRGLFFSPPSRTINLLSGLEAIKWSYKRSNKLSILSKKSVLQSKLVEQHQVLHLNDTADYRLGPWFLAL